jgi:hypothetical protein
MKDLDHPERVLWHAPLQPAPQVLPSDWADISAKLNISDSGSAWVRLAGDLGIVKAGSRDGRLVHHGERRPPVRRDDTARRPPPGHPGAPRRLRRAGHGNQAVIERIRAWIDGMRAR